MARATAILNPPPVDTRREWQKNLVAVTPTVFTLYSPVPIINMATGAVVGSVPAGPLTVDHQTTAAGVAYWVTTYGATHGNGLRMADVVAATKATVPPPQVLPVATTGGSVASGVGSVTVVPGQPDVPVPPGGWQALLNSLLDLSKAILGRP